MIGERLRACRLANNMTQTQLAKTLGVTNTTINRLESNAASPNCENLIKICKLFSVSSDFLLGIE